GRRQWTVAARLLQGESVKGERGNIDPARARAGFQQEGLLHLLDINRFWSCWRQFPQSRGQCGNIEGMPQKCKYR
ncbi:hypothetical protein HKBW3S42_01902, partial [Candidatus Hakubella thermalkaliphila]